VCAQEALVQLELDEVLFVPFGQPPHRELPDDPGPEARVELCELAVAEDDRITVSRIEVDRPGPSYTVDTLAELRKRSPDDELFLILGGDQAASLPEWREPERVLELATVATVPRTGWSRERIAVKVASVRGSDRVRFFDMPRIDVSSSLVRHRAARGEPIRYLVPDRVAAYIDSHSLYGASTAVGAD
jgi:nicotinate-nucleotide adenylyltransferase